jgi:tryptophan synthase alpha chain
MSRITEMFDGFAASGEKALITYITAGDPDLLTTKRLLFALQKAGADIIELGIPFSDPMADGPTIQRASFRALRNGTNLRAIFDMLRETKGELKVPIILFGYYNPIFQYGMDRFIESAKEAGIEGLLIVDLPLEESGEIKKYTDKIGIDLINLVSPVTDEERLKHIVTDASGFLYYISVTGVTGVRSEIPKEIFDQISKIKKATKLPVVVGFGVSSPEAAHKISRVADGVVVGSAIVNIIEKNGGNNISLLLEVQKFVSSLKTKMSEP